MRLTIIVTLLLSAPAFANTVYTCVPNSKVSSSENSSVRQALSSQEATSNSLKIVRSGKKFLVTTRENREVQMSLSGIYTVFYEPGITVKIESGTNNYFEFVHMGTNTITYFGKCL